MTRTDSQAVARGGCLCGAVRYRTSAPLRPIVVLPKHAQEGQQADWFSAPPG